MCGIIGVVREGAAQSRAAVVTARDLMWHRGPDDAGVWASDHACLAARRLSVIDLTAAGHQPMVSDDGRRVLVFNGEIYNFHDLRRQLEPEFHFRSHTDGEVILHGYRKWGFDGLLRRLDGMFAFALWDEDERTLVGARDRAGKKPFHYVHDGRTLQFASTADALLALLPATPPIDPHALDAYLVYQTVPAPLSMFRGLRQLSAAHAMVFRADTGAITVEPYWRLSFATKTAESEREVLDHVESLARQAVRKRLESDVPVGVFLSGGVDSSLVTALAVQESARPIEGVILGFDEPGFDERRYGRVVAAHLGMKLHEETLHPGLVADLPSIVGHYGQPVADVSIVPNHYLARAARRWMTVALNGDGGDELFGGYARPMLAHLTAPYRRLVPAPLRRAIGGALDGQREGPLRRVALLARTGAVPAADAFVYDRAFRRFRAEAYAPSLLAQLGTEHPDALYRSVWDEADATDDVDRALYGDFKTYLPDQLLEKADRASMAHSLETRSPLLDQALIEYSATIPTALRLKHLETKHLLKAVAARFVPPAVVYRPKHGFVMPVAKWLRGELAPYARGALDRATFYDRGWVTREFVRRILAEHAAGTQDWGEQVFTLLVLEVWARITLDRTLVSGERMDVFLQSPARPPRPRHADASEKLRTLQLGMEWFPEKPGGLNRVYYELTRHLPAANVEVHGLVAGTDAVGSDSGGMVHGFAPRTEALLPRLLAVRRMARPLLRADPGMLFVTHFALYASPLLDSLQGRPMVVHFHGPWGLEGEAEHQSPLTVFAKSAVERAVYRRATRFIVLSPPFATILREFGIPESRISVIPGGVDWARFAIGQSRDECRARLGWPAGRPVVLAVRRLMRRMGLDDLVDAAALLRERLPGVLVLIAGRGPQSDELAQRIHQRGLDDHVRLLGFVDDRDLPAAYRAADLSIVPSLALEGFGLVVAESLAAGTPCLVTPVGGLPEAVGALSPRLILGDTGPVAIAEGVAAAFSGALSLPGAEECAEFARNNYDWPVIVARTRQVYEEALG